MVPERDVWKPAALCDAFYRTCAVVMCAILDSRASTDTLDTAMEWIAMRGNAPATLMDLLREALFEKRLSTDITEPEHLLASSSLAFFSEV